MKLKRFNDFESVSEALSPLQKEYREFFRYMLDKYEVASPASLSEEKKKDFFNEVQDGWVKGQGATKKAQKEMEEFYSEK